MFNKPVVYKENKPGEAQETLCIDNTARNILGWEPKTDIKSYIQNK